MTSREPVAVRPPRIAAWLAARLMRTSAWQDTALGDLQEEFAVIAGARGARAARRWYRREVVTLSAERLAARARAVIAPSGDRPMRRLTHELRLALRSLRRQPLVTAIVIGTLALGLGANAATFGMVDRLLLHPFTIPDVDRLVVVGEMSTTDELQQMQESVAPGNFVEWRDQVTSLERLTAFAWWDVNLSGGDRPERVQGHQVTGEFLSLFGAPLIAGRALSRDDERPGRDRVAVISEGLWRRRFGAAPDVVGRTVHLDGEPYELVGVVGGDFSFPYATEVWAPLVLDADDRANHRSSYLTVAGALPPDGTIDRAASELAALYDRQRREHPADLRERSLAVRPFTESMIDVGLPQILVLWQTAALLVLLIGCVNIVNLLLARGAERQRELAVRLAIGAGRARIVLQLLVESLVVAVLSVPAALAVAWLAFHLIRAAMPASLIRFIPGWTSMGVDARVVLMTLTLAAATAMLFGLLPALRSSRPGLVQALRDGGRSTSAGRGRNRLRRGLVVAQIAVALPLLMLSGLAAVGTQRFASGPQGYEPQGLIRLRMLLPDALYPDDTSRRQFVDRLLEEARQVPGVELATTTTVTPAATTGDSREIVVEGAPLDPDSALPRANYRAVSPDYFSTMQIPILEGQPVGRDDRDGRLPVAIVSASMAERHWPGRSPIGERIRFGRQTDVWFTVVGVAGDTIDNWFASRHSPTVYVPAAQAPPAQVFLVARTSGDPGALADGLRQAVAAVDPMQAPFDVATMPAAIRERTTGLRFVSALMLAFGLVALVLSSFGIYGVMAHHVVQRRHDIGVRMALGATGGRVLRHTLLEGATLSATGIVLGLGIGIALARAMESALFGVASLEPALVAAITTGLASVALAATLVPARHATRIDPMTALRSE